MGNKIYSKKHKDNVVVAAAAGVVIGAEMEIEIDELRDIEYQYFKLILVPDLMRAVNKKRLSQIKLDTLIKNYSNIRPFTQQDILQLLSLLKIDSLKKLTATLDSKDEPLDKNAFQLLNFDDEKVVKDLRKSIKGFSTQAMQKNLGKKNDILKIFIFANEYIPQLLIYYQRKQLQEIERKISNNDPSITSIDNINELLMTEYELTEYLDVLGFDYKNIDSLRAFLVNIQEMTPRLERDEKKLEIKKLLKGIEDKYDNDEDKKKVKKTYKKLLFNSQTTRAEILNIIDLVRTTGKSALEYSKKQQQQKPTKKKDVKDDEYVKEFVKDVMKNQRGIPNLNEEDTKKLLYEFAEEFDISDANKRENLKKFFRTNEKLYFKQEKRRILENLETDANISMDQLYKSFFTLDGRDRDFGIKEKNQKLEQDVLNVLKKPPRVYESSEDDLKSALKKVLLTNTTDTYVMRIKDKPDEIDELIEVISNTFDLDTIQGRMDFKTRLENNDLSPYQNLFSNDVQKQQLIKVLRKEQADNVVVDEKPAVRVSSPEQDAASELIKKMVVIEKDTQNALRNVLKDQQIRLYNQYGVIVDDVDSKKNIDEKLDEIIDILKKKK
jgi:hypothetical protein